MRSRPFAHRSRCRWRVQCDAMVAANNQVRRLRRDCKLCAEFLRLNKRARRKRLTGDAGWKSEIVLDPRGGTGLTPERAAIKNHNRETLRCRIHGCSEASW